MSYIKEQLPYTLDVFEGGDLGERYKGKVRENFYMGDEIIMVTTDRVSAFDHVLGPSHLRVKFSLRLLISGLKKPSILLPIILFPHRIPRCWLPGKQKPFQ